MGIEVHRQLATFGAFAGDDYRTVCSLRAVESCGGSSFQNTEALDVLWVDVYQTIGTDLSVVAKFSEVRAFARAAVADGYPVQNDECWLFPVIEVRPRTLMETAPAEPPCVCVMRTPGALPYMAEAKLGAPAFTNSSALMVLMA